MLTEVLRRTGGVAIGTAVGQGLILLATPYLARRYSPSDFGALALLVTVGNIAIQVGCLRYDVALPSSREENVRGLLITSMLTALAMGVAGALLAVALSATSLGVSAASALLDRPLVVGACIVSVATYQAAGAWLLRRGRYPAFSAMRAAQGGGFSALAALPGPGLLWAHAMSFGAGVLVVSRALRKPSATDEGWRAAAQRYASFPLLSLPGAVLDVVGYSICIWVVASYYGRSAAGEYSQVQRLIGAPLMLVSMSLGQILLRRTAELASDRPRLRLLLLRLLNLLALMAGLALVALWLVGEPALALILGPDWNIDKEMIVVLGAAVFVRASVSPLSTALIAIRRFGLTLGWQAAYFCSALLLMPFVASRVQLRDYVRFYALHETVMYGAYLALILSALRNERCAASSES